MPSSTSPVIIFLPGMMCRGTSVYAPLIRYLTSQYSIPSSDLQPLDLPFTDPTASHSPNSLASDIAFVRSHIQSLIASKRSVLIIAHSYSGCISLAASAGLWSHLNPEGVGVSKTGIIAGSLCPPGSSIAGDREGWKQANPQDAWKIDDTKGAQIEKRGEEMWVIPDGVEEVWMDDFEQAASSTGQVAVTKEELAQVKGGLVASNLEGALTPNPGKEEDVKDWRVSYLMTMGDSDKAMPEAFQKWLVQRAKDMGGQVDVHECKGSGHFPQVSKLEEVAEWVHGLMKSV